MSRLDFLDLDRVDETFIVDVRYATTNNFTKKVLYPIPKCFLRREVALKLAEVQKSVRERWLRLKIFDAYRPQSIQWKLWEIMPDPHYVADPSVGSKHNRGASVDLTLVDFEGNELLMPTPFDNFTIKAHRDCMDLPPAAIANRELLEKVMQEQGFLPLPTEWWHFDDEEWDKYPVEDLSLEEIEHICSVSG